MKKLLVLSAMALFCADTWAQTNPTPQTIPYSENFNTVTHTSTTYPNGWQGWTITTAPSSSFSTAIPTADRNLTASSTAAVNSGNVHNYNGKIGFLNTSSLDLGLVLAINTSSRSNIVVSYDIMTLRNPYDTTTNTRVNEVILQYRIGTSGTFTNLTGTEYQNNTLTQTTAITTAQNMVSKSITLPSACDNQSVVQLRWASRQVSGGGSRPSFAIDNVVVDTPSNRISIVKGTDATEGTTPTAGSFNITFNPVTAGSTAFNYQITGTATFNTDYSISLSGGATPATLSSTTGTITVPASTGSITATVTPINDALSEGAETVNIKITTPSSPYNILDSVATINIIDDEATLISTIQGTGAAATAGNFTIEGIVTGVYTTLSPAGFYMQEEDADKDSNPATSEGIFVVTSNTVAVGDKVRVSGTVLESSAAPSYNQAVISSTSISTMSTGNPLPAYTNISLPLANINDYEKYECMLVRFQDTLTVTDNYNLGRYGEINLSKGGMTFQPTQIVDPNDATASGTTSIGTSNLTAVNAYADANSLRTILMDDGKGTMTALPFVNNDNTLRLGSTTINLVGILGYAFSKYRIQPIPSAMPVFNYAPRPATPAMPSATNVKVSSFNVLNYFNGNGSGGGFPTARGAHSPVEFTRQRDKIINAIADINADVVGLIEMENDGTATTSALLDIINGLNAKMGAGTYTYVYDGTSIQNFGTDAIRCAIIYKPSIVDTAGSVMISSNSVFNRPPVAQTFEVIATGIKFNYIINHFKSKGCSGSTGADADQLDGQSCYNDTRKKQATELINFINNTVIANSGEKRVISMGDYNAYYQEDPLDIFRANGYTVLSEDTAYSYLFSGLVGSLDNAIVNDSMKKDVTAIAKWHLNSAEPIFLDYNDNIDDGGGDFVNQWGNTYSSIPFRSSDHDPVIVGLSLKKPITGSVATVTYQPYKIYPNPSTDVLYIANRSNTVAIAQIINTVGQVVSTIDIDGNTVSQTDIRNLNNGVYIIRINTEGNYYTQQFVKQ